VSSEPRERLRIAVQKSGRLSDASIDLLARCGLKFRTSRDKLFCYGESLPVDLLLVRDDDIPGLIAQGVCELGFVGRNVAREKAAELRASGAADPFVEIADLGFGPCRLSIAIPQDEAWVGPLQLAGKRIATSYPALLGEYLASHGVDAQIVVLNGAVEIAPKLGTADYICDLVSSGGTLLANQLKEVAIIMQSEAVLIGSAQLYPDERAALKEMLLRRLEGVLKQRESKLLLFRAPRSAVPTLVKLLPEAELPTLARLDGIDDAVSVQIVCHQALTWLHLEELKRHGASQMLVMPVEKMLA
jgi:ATP phosphoribosyltransferase